MIEPTTQEDVMPTMTTEPEPTMTPATMTPRALLARWKVARARVAEARAVSEDDDLIDPLALEQYEIEHQLGALVLGSIGTARPEGCESCDDKPRAVAVIDGWAFVFVPHPHDRGVWVTESVTPPENVMVVAG